MNIGILGGTFSPIHYGHTFIANYILDFMDFDKILFIPSGKPPNKNNVIKKEHRLRMVELAIKDNPKFELDDFEIQKNDYSYTYDTLNYLMSKNKNDKFYFIIGQEAMLQMKTWYRCEDVLKLTDFIVVTRGTQIKDMLLSMYDSSKLHFINTPIINISSTDIRNRVSQNKSIKYYVNGDVEQYIISNKIYKENANDFDR